ncbi:WhiB family transcriptional regulator [Cellulomonas taurus]|uniref:WhiB family transcriptional regulator n=1 Tax=Cellulomonas taurus TaxID=2729175 RepID=UPI00145DD52A|nr:WhiB family transcriptional regulator [Cellulomonas taurus]
MMRVSAFTVVRSGTVTPDYEKDEHWLYRAACVDEHPEVFEPDDDHTPTEAEWAVPRAICSACPVIEECLADAMKTEAQGARYGMRGGTSPDERRTLHRRRLARAQVGAA